MPYTCTDDFIPIAEAFEQAVEALCTAPVLSVGSWTTESTEIKEPRKPNSFEKYDEMRRRIEKLMRDAIADGDLDAFIPAVSGQLERLIERKSFRDMSFGIPGFDNVPHHLTSPGEDTGGRPVCLKKSDFEKWLRHNTPGSRRGSPIKFDWPDAKNFAIKLLDEGGEFREWDTEGEWKTQADLERKVLNYMEKTAGPGKGPAESTLRAKISEWLTEWRKKAVK